MPAPKKKMTREEAWAWAHQLAKPDLPSVLACAIPPPAPSAEAAARIAVGSVAPARVGAVAHRLARLVALEAEAAEGAAGRARARHG